MDSDWILADVHMRGYPAPDTEATVYWHRDGAFVIFPISPGRYRLIADMPASGEAHPPVPTLEQVQTLINRRGPSGMTAFDPIWLAGFRINGRKVASYRWGRAFLCGDAAHVHSPAGGQGMNTGMQDAFNLAWKLALVIKGCARPSLLDSYSPERSAVGDRVLRNAGRLTEAAILRNPVLQGIRNTVGKFATGFPFVQHKIANQLSELDIGYPGSPLTVKNGHVTHGPKSGERWPDRLPAGAAGAKFTALGPADAVAALAVKFPKLVLPAPTQDPTHKTALRLIRPDGYVAYAGAAKDQKQAEAYLAALAAS